MKKSKKKEIEKLKNLKDNEINYAEIPETDTAFWQDAEIVYPVEKKPIYINLDEDIITWFKSYGRGYQAKINAVLKSYMRAMEKQKS